MPPPTSADSWLAARRFGIVIDAGSSGSRLQIYSWKDPSVVLKEHGDDVRRTLPKVDKGVKEGEEWITKVEPGIIAVILGLSSFADNPDGVASYLAPLLEHARSHIPPSLESETPLFLLATAGMRLLTPIQQARIIHSACHYLKASSSFRIDDSSPDGPCGSSVQIITGEEEGLYGWIAVNYLMDGFNGQNENRTTYGFLDMGGASTQIAFEPSPESRDNSHNLVDVRLRLLGGEEIKHQVFVTTWLGYGTNQARERYIAAAIKEYEQNRLDSSSSIGSSERFSIDDPCLPKDLELLEYPLQPEGSSQSVTPYKLVGTDFSVSHFIGVSEYWYSSEHVFGLGGPYDFVQYERAASDFCGRDWTGIVKQHETSRQQGRIGGDGEVMEDGQVVNTGIWGDKVEISRLEMQCFKAAWVANVLHEGIGIPRIVDPGGNTTTAGDKVAQQAESKGLGRPVFQSVDTVGDIAISWTLGKMVLEASKEVPPASRLDRPLVDPVDDIPESPNPPIKPIRPPLLDLDAIEDHLSQHLPPSLSRESLGFSPVAFLFYVVLLFVIFCMTYRLRHYLRLNLRRLIRGPFKRDYEEVYSMEEGGRSTPPSPTSCLPPTLTRTLRRFSLLSSGNRPIPSRPRLVPISTVSPKGSSWNTHTSPYNSPTHSTFHYQDGASTTTSSQYISRSSSPTVGFNDDNILSNSISSLTSMTTRSRNSSQLNLTTLVPRQTPLSRANSMLQIPPGGSFRDE
ncbi:hypothetical protein SERLADRAFT_417574 [Serpula lacrymans var. lacrymans S7.9]|uniref:Uncharacterized protein n=1 Tax=Serpula lacrymans var. lacrymans (strain S7.9) TaxID=578457 RepID=F8P6Z9_SERL9|nr:uncharacterized protein SERLADRAFT_417574 [Serpula lacrymans var. lacrymans S7.9]EGO21215.1 hypothetical protein SERLADRAFT_417574 [Serpula lacrymans var. lacrymans S7.9]